MNIRRIVPNIASADMHASREFYAGFLGLDVAMDMEWIVTFASPDNPTAQISVLADSTDHASAAVTLTVEVADVDRAHSDAVSRGFEIVYPLTTEPWGVRRFHVNDPNGVLVNVMSHGAHAA